MKIQYKNTSITISANAFGTINNGIRYSISSDMADAEDMQALFEGVQFNLRSGLLTSTDIVQVPNMWEIINTVQIEASDVGKTAQDVIKTWTVNMIYQMNLLNLDLNDWAIVE